jgi:hypothetical protein
MPLPPSPCYQPEWIYRRVKPVDKSAVEDAAWPAIIRPRSKADRSVPMLGHSKSFNHDTRPRGPSVSSIPSVATASSSSSKVHSRQAKSILTRTSSSSTKNSLAKSVKFADMPTVHYDYDEDSYDDCEIDSPTSPIPSRDKPLQGFRRYIWPSWRSQPVASPPQISAPLVLGSIKSPAEPSDSASVRSTRSNGSVRSERNLHTVSGSFPLRTARSTESFRSAKYTGNSRLRAFLGKMIH